MRLLALAAALTMTTTAVEARSTNQMLRDGHLQGQIQGLQRFGGSPPFPLFRCDGQRAPLLGGGHCQNWRIQDMQEKLLRDEMRRRGLR